MEERWYFVTDRETGDVEMTARFVGDDGSVGDARDVVSMGDKLVDPPGLTYEALREAVAGVLIIKADRSFVIEGEPPEAPPPAVTDVDLRALFHADLLGSSGVHLKT